MSFGKIYNVDIYAVKLKIFLFKNSVKIICICSMLRRIIIFDIILYCIMGVALYGAE
jgi:hypothetical protein